SLVRFLRSPNFKIRSNTFRLYSKDSSGMYYAYGNMANTFSSMKNFEKSLEYNLKVLDLILKLGERRNLTRLYTNIGWTYFNYGDTTNMLKYYTLSAEDAQSRSDTLSMIYSFINLGDLLMDLERFDSSRLLLNKVVELSQKGNSAYLVHLANFEQGKLLFRSGEKEKGLNQLLSAKKGLIENGAKTNDYSDFLVISDAYDDLGLLNQALKNTEEVYKVSDERGSVSIKLHALEKIHDYYLRSGQPRKAYEAIQELLSLRTDLFDETKASIVGGMEAEQRLYKKQEEYELLALEAQAQAEKSRAQRLIFTLSVIILIAVMAVILLFYRQQKIRKKLVESELSVKKEQNKSMANELEYKNRELVNFAVQITQKNEFIELLDDKIKANQGEGLSEVNEVIQANQSISKDREEFEMHVQNVYEGFFIKLNELYPDITPAEKKLAALLRLDLSSKEISTILNISPKSVDMSRYRLRKKMSLEGSSSLTETLQNI
ncbi:MAG: LuxR C-terminal-related transcriptional regulator, partial [Bacteroidota bacterium]